MEDKHKIKNRNIILVENENTKYEITLVAQFCGDDLNISVFGGEKAHIGAVAIAVANIEGYERKYSPTISCISVLDHKDEAVARHVAKELSTYLNSQVVVTAGIHIDNATEDDIKKIMVSITNITETLIKHIKN